MRGDFGFMPTPIRGRTAPVIGLYILAIAVIALLVYCILKKKNAAQMPEGFQHGSGTNTLDFSRMPNAYRNPGSKGGCTPDAGCADYMVHCQTPEGLDGVCTRFGLCCPSFLLDQDRTRELNEPVPHCSIPLTSEGCPSYCSCIRAKGTQVNMNECITQCSAKLKVD